MAQVASLRAPTSRLGRRPLRKCTAHAASLGAVRARYAASASTFSPVFVVSSSSAYSAAKDFTGAARLQGTGYRLQPAPAAHRDGWRRIADSRPELAPVPYSAVVPLRRKREVVAQPLVDLGQRLIIHHVLRLV